MISLPEQLTRTGNFTAGAPDQFTIGPDGTVLFLRSRAGDDPVACLWSLTDVERLLADPVALLAGEQEEISPAERTRRERVRHRGAGIAGYRTDDSAKVIAFALSGDLWVVTDQPRRLPAMSPVIDPCPDPSGRWIAYVSGGGLRVIGVDGSGDRAVAMPDGPEVTFGLPEHVASESMLRYHGYWWAPDGERLLVSRVDNSRVATWWISDPAEPSSEPRPIRYPAAGTANAEVTLWIAGLDGTRAEVPWDRETFEYVTAAGWDEHGPFAAVQSRDQRTVSVLGLDPVTVLATQTDEHWVQLVPGLPARIATGSLVSHADIEGTRHLTVAGEVVTPPGLQLSEVLGLDGSRVLFAASAEPMENQLWLYAPGQPLRQLSTEPGVHHGVLRGGTFVHVAATPHSARREVTVHRAGQPDVRVASLSEEPVIELHSAFAVVGERALRTQLFLPSWHRPGSAKLPVLLDPYGGPAMRKVTAEQAPYGFVSQWFAEQGFAVLVADGSGTPGRGPIWEREVSGDMFSRPLEDQITALFEVSRANPDLDLGRVAMRGWSFSGSLAALAVMRRPDVFHAAIAGAGVTDQRLYDTHWRERFLGHPDLHPEHYDACSLLLEAPKLTRPLLLIHGMADDNVFPANTLRLSHALLSAGRPHEFLPLTGAAHSGGGSLVASLLAHQLDFLRRRLPQAATGPRDSR